MKLKSGRQFAEGEPGKVAPFCSRFNPTLSSAKQKIFDWRVSRLPNVVSGTRQIGQSLVEVALFLPIFVILLAGLIEVSQIVIAQNRISNAARTGTRFAANGGEDDGVIQVTLDGVTQTLDAQEGAWDIWTIRGKVNSAGDGFDEWEFAHAYGVSNTVRFAEVDESAIQAEVLAELQSGQSGSSPGNAADLEIVGTYLIHDVDSILGLDALPALSGVNSVKGVSVMRLVGFDNEDTDGCDAFPIAIHEGVRSATAPGSGPYPFPAAADFHPDSPKPDYADFVNHDPNVLLADAKEGYVFVIEHGFAPGEFGWLRWNTGRPSNDEVLGASLTWPGNSKDYRQLEYGSELPIVGRVLGYVEPNDVTDTSLHIGDRVADTYGSVDNDYIRGKLNDHIDKGRVLRVIIWDKATDYEDYGEYTISGFGMFRLQGYNLSSGWLLAEFVSWDSSCGQA
jgi:Flp pilus assembly protein TadG